MDDTIRIRQGKKWEPARLANIQPPQPRSYNVEREGGTILRRNRRFIRQTDEKDIFHRRPPNIPELDMEDPGHMVPPPLSPPPPTSPNIVRPNTVRSPPNMPPPASPINSRPQTVTTRCGREIVKPSRFRDYVTE
jgi:hypothetical protein